MRKSNAAAEITRMPAPMHETLRSIFKVDIFTYDGEYTRHGACGHSKGYTLALALRLSLAEAPSPGIHP